MTTKTHLGDPGADTQDDTLRLMVLRGFDVDETNYIDTWHEYILHGVVDVSVDETDAKEFAHENTVFVEFTTGKNAHITGSIIEVDF